MSQDAVGAELMSIGTLLKREAIVSVGRGELFRDRLWAVALVGTTVVSCLLVWDWKGWGRSSVAGASSFAHVAFGLVAAVQLCFSIGFVLPVARSIASERERKTLDALLATRLSSPQIVLGVMAAGLFRFANATAATLPVVVLLLYLGGVDPRFALLACVAASSTALGVAALSAAASVESRTSAHATALAAGLLYGWFGLPAVILALRGMFLPLAPAWVMRPLLWSLDSSPLGPAASYFGILPRPWGLADAVCRMAAIQVTIAGALTGWAAWRLRPASRASYDVEGRTGMLRALRQANRSLPRRPPCGADPVLWNEIHGLQVKNRVRRVADQLVHLASIGLWGFGAWWFAAPAFVELAERGYGPSAAAYAMPESNPLARVIAERLVVGSSAAPEPGQARLEFNLALRQFSAIMALGFAVTMFSLGVESINRERRRDTWLGLLATPLSGREIIRGKVLGTLRKNREALAILTCLWTAGLASGAVHPGGFLVATAWLAAAGPLYGALGISTALQSDRQHWPSDPSTWPKALATALAMILAMTIPPLFLASAPLFTYEEVQSVARSAVFPPFSRTFLRSWVGARSVALACLTGVAATAAWAVVHLGILSRSFDALVGRPWRTPEP